jgi:hypothetical protein
LRGVGAPRFLDDALEVGLLVAGDLVVGVLGRARRCRERPRPGLDRRQPGVSARRALSHHARKSAKSTVSAIIHALAVCDLRARFAMITPRRD